MEQTIPQTVAQHAGFFNDPYSIAVALAVLIISVFAIKVMIDNKDSHLEYDPQMD